MQEWRVTFCCTLLHILVITVLQNVGVAFFYDEIVIVWGKM